MRLIVAYFAKNEKLPWTRQDIEDVAYYLDVPPDRVEEIEDRVKMHRPEPQIEATDTTIPPFP